MGSLYNGSSYLKNRWHNFYKSLLKYRGEEIPASFFYGVSIILMPKLDKDNIERKLKINISTKYRQKSLNKNLARRIQ